ncbi:MAG: 1-(5-phosphoribosyl)-5-[(5-phosphoribosylamino)methylideneamino] imidazole-4-carboxamide isomerase [Polyangiaceae bacterium]
MKILPAIDLREGACVQLVGGSYDDERVRLPDPLAICRKFSGAGLVEQHIVDLDAALGKGSNLAVIEQIAKEPGVTIEVGGGIRTSEDVTRLIELGVARVIVGTRAIEDLAWLEIVAAKFPERILLAADVRGRTIVTRGWTKTLELTIGELLKTVATLPLAGALVTAVHVEGQMTGPDLDLVREAVASKTRIFASGGISSLEDLRALKTTGAHAVVVGMAIYTGRIDPNDAAREMSRELVK